MPALDADILTSRDSHSSGGPHPAMPELDAVGNVNSELLEATVRAHLEFLPDICDPNRARQLRLDFVFEM